MTANHILVLIIMLVLPVCTILLGMKRMKSAAPLGSKGGYRSERSMISAEAWTFAQKINGLYYTIGGAVMVVLSVLLTIALPEMKTAAPMITYALVFASAWVVMNLVLMVLTETAIMGKHFTK